VEGAAGAAAPLTAAQESALAAAAQNAPVGGATQVLKSGGIVQLGAEGAAPAFDQAAKIGALKSEAAGLAAKGEQAMALKNLLFGGPAGEAPPAQARGRARRPKTQAPMVEDQTTQKGDEIDQLIAMILGGKQ